MVIQPIVDIPEICHAHGVKQAVISPGSRSAAITLAFARHPGITTFVVPDERSAGFIALGLAQSSRKPVALICTSGTATANLYPAIIEAYYQQVPLLVLTADRPPEWTDQEDGQTIRQQNLYQNHILGFFQFPVAFDHPDAKWHANRLVNEALLKATGDVKGPVHLNIPVREPFYPLENEQYRFSKNVRIISRTHPPKASNQQLPEDLIRRIGKYRKIMIIAGQGQWGHDLMDALDKLQEKFHWVVVGDAIGNIHQIPNVITKHDVILMKKASDEGLAPDLLITFGMSVISKALKGFLRSAKPAEHWHVGTSSVVVDTFKALTLKIQIEPEQFFKGLQKWVLLSAKEQQAFWTRWQAEEKQAGERMIQFFRETNEGEFFAVKKLLDVMPADCDLHLANSMPVRYVNYIGLKQDYAAMVWANRGTSGIDGCTGTAVGHALNSAKIQVLITGDVAFFYDRNALWHQHIPANLRIVLLNNQGGGIFRLIDGPAMQPELETFFEARHHLTAKNTAADFNLRYFSSNGSENTDGVLKDFFNPKAGASILEIITEPEINSGVFARFRDFFKI